MRYLIVFLLVTSNAFGKCFYTDTGTMCGYESKNEIVIANRGCEVVDISIDRQHLKLEDDGSIACPPVVDNVRKKDHEDKIKLITDKEKKKDDAKQWLKDNENSLTSTQKKFKEALGL